MLGGLCSCEDAFEIETLAQATLDREHNQTLLRLKKDVVKSMPKRRTIHLLCWINVTVVKEKKK